MKLKKLFLLLLLALGAAHSTFAQKGVFFTSFDIGYGFRAAPNTEISHSNSTYSNTTYSVGRGFNAALSGAYMLGNHIGAGLDIGYLLGGKTSLIDNASNFNSTLDMSARMLSFTPHIFISANAERINPYCRFGVVLGSASVTWKEQESGFQARSGTAIEKFSGNLAMGWYGALGLQYAISDKLMLNAELFNRSMSYAPKTAENTQAFDGEKKDDTYTFVKNINSSSSKTDANQIYWPLSSMGFMVGISMRIGAAQ